MSVRIGRWSNERRSHDGDTGDVEMKRYYFDRQHVEVQRARLIRKLETLGLKVTVEELPQAA